MFKPGQAFLNAYVGKDNSDQNNLIASNVLVPDMNPDGSFKTILDERTKEPHLSTFNIRKDYPQLPLGQNNMGGDGNPYRAFGLFGPSGQTQSRTQIRGMMQFVPGGIPASPGFNYDETLKNYPEEMKGIQRGNMPVFGTPY